MIEHNGKLSIVLKAESTHEAQLLRQFIAQDGKLSVQNYGPNTISIGYVEISLE